MSRLCQARFLAAVLFAAAQLAVAQETNRPTMEFSPTPTNHFSPSLLQARSPVDLFRKLLAMTSEERENYLTNRPPQIRERILAKVREYEALDPNERELRLRATELRWYLLPLMQESPTNYPARLAEIPADMRELVESRLEQWELLPPPLQQELLDDERAVNYFTEIKPSHSNVADESDTARWNALSDNDRKKITVRVNQFFDLTPEEKQETLATLSKAERQQMEKTLQAFDQLPPGQRTECIQAFAKFAGMSPAEQQEFLKNAARWSQMSPADRQAWRDLVTHVPEWPPLPPGILPPLPPSVAVATNHD